MDDRRISPYCNTPPPITLFQWIPLIVVIAGGVGIWTTLNITITEMKSNQKHLVNAVNELKSDNKVMKTQLNDLERSLAQIYRLSTNK